MNTQELAQEIQKRHHVGLSPNDPIFVTLTLNEILLANHLEQFESHLESLQDQLKASMLEKINDSLSLSASQSNQVLAAMEGTFKNAGQDIKAMIDATVNAQMNKIQQEVQAGVAKVKQASEVFQMMAYGLVALAFFLLGILFKTVILH